VQKPNGNGNGVKVSISSWVSLGLVIVLLTIAVTWGATYRQVAIDCDRIDRLELLAQSNMSVQAQQVEATSRMTKQLDMIQQDLKELRKDVRK